MEDKRELLRLLAELLEYPGTDLRLKAKRCRQLLEQRALNASEAIGRFAAFVESENPARLEEIYTSSFDLNPQCYPYAGYQLFGEDPKRAALMVRLQQGFCERGFSAGTELPDHVPLLMRFLSELQDEDAGQELQSLVLAPALAKMAKTLEEKQNPYAAAVNAALLVMSE